jgi:hypothetical protein
LLLKSTDSCSKMNYFIFHLFHDIIPCMSLSFIFNRSSRRCRNKFLFDRIDLRRKVILIMGGRIKLNCMQAHIF